MKVAELLLIQKQLDDRIESKHPLKPGEDRRVKRQLALFVELGELANEVRVFKYWSHDQKPRMQAFSAMWSSKCKNPTLEEAADVMHFMLIIANELRIKDAGLSVLRKMSLEEQFLELFDHTRTIYHPENWHWTWSLFLGLIDMLGFKWAQLCEAYIAKNAENIRRLETGY